MGSPIEDAAEAATEGLHNFHPQGPEDLIGLFNDMPDFFKELADGMTAVVNKCDEELPINPAVTEQFRELVATIAGLQDHASELNGLFRVKHSEEIKRVEDPRPQEELWDVQNKA